MRNGQFERAATESARNCNGLRIPDENIAFGSGVREKFYQRCRGAGRGNATKCDAVHKNRIASRDARAGTDIDNERIVVCLGWTSKDTPHDSPIDGIRTQKDAKAATTTLVYDLLGRVTDKTIGSRAVKWEFTINATTAKVDGARQVKTATVTEGAEIFRQTWAYDALSRVSGTTRCLGAVGTPDYTFGQSYDSFSRPTVMTYPSTDGAAYATLQLYTGLGYLTQD